MTTAIGVTRQLFKIRENPSKSDFIRVTDWRVEMMDHRKKSSGRSRGIGRRKLFFLSVTVLVAILAGCSADSKVEQPDTPVRIAWAAGAQLLVSDYQKQSVQFRDSQTLAVQRSLAIKGHPLAVGYAQGKVLVGNETTQCVEVYDSTSGVMLYTLGDGPGSIPLPNDLAIDEASGRVFVTDSSNKRVAVFSLDGPLLYSIMNRLLVQPISVVLDATAEHLYVGNLGLAPSTYGGNVLVFTSTGQFERSIAGDFTHPKGLTVDDAGHLYLVDAILGQVLVFDALVGQEIARLGIAPPYAGPHKMPFDSVFDGGSQRILVTDYLLGKIEAYAVTEATP
jgi:DNA-binding beta-propeller fold protein YncE